MNETEWQEASLDFDGETIHYRWRVEGGELVVRCCGRENDQTPPSAHGENSALVKFIALSMLRQAKDDAKKGSSSQ